MNDATARAGQSPRTTSLAERLKQKLRELGIAGPSPRAPRAQAPKQ